MSNVLILGASRGLGLEFARQYVADGDRVLATARDAAGRERLQALGVENVLTVDVANPASISGLAWMLDGEKIDTALYVAGIMGHSCFVSRIGVVHHRSQLYAARCSFGEQLSVAAVKYGHPRRFAPVLGQRQ